MTNTGEEEEISVSQPTRVSSSRTRNAVIERKTTINAASTSFQFNHTLPDDIPKEYNLMISNF
jgi:hypothetical protein